MTTDHDGYGILADFYDTFIGESYYAQLGELFDRLVAGATPGATYLDIGCGTGWLLKYAADRALITTGVDISPAMWKLAAQRSPESEVLCLSAHDLLGRQWQLLSANGDVFNHMVRAAGLDETLSLLRDLLHPGGSGLIDAVSAYDVLHNWEGCRHEYSDGSRIRCNVSHAVGSLQPVTGLMRRTWSRRSEVEWVVIGEELEEVLGLTPADLTAASERVGLCIELFDWDLGGPISDSTSRIGAWISR